MSDFVGFWLQQIIKSRRNLSSQTTHLLVNCSASIINQIKCWGKKRSPNDLLNIYSNVVRFKVKKKLSHCDCKWKISMVMHRKTSSEQILHGIWFAFYLDEWFTGGKALLYSRRWIKKTSFDEGNFFSMATKDGKKARIFFPFVCSKNIFTWQNNYYQQDNLAFIFSLNSCNHHAENIFFACSNQRLRRFVRFHVWVRESSES